MHIFYLQTKMVSQLFEKKTALFCISLNYYLSLHLKSLVVNYGMQKHKI